MPDRELQQVAALFEGAHALEIGGPSAIFAPGGLVPVYERLEALDAGNFAARTLWDQERFKGIVPSRTFLSEARDLPADDASYDAVLGSHVIEHTANPLGVLREWRRVTKPGGRLLLVVPHKEATFDHRRPVTSIEHLRDDEDRDTPEDDETHLDEILRLHDLRRDPGTSSTEEFAERSRQNPLNRALHHHVFVTEAVQHLCEAASLDVETLTTRRPHHIVCVARRPHDEASAPRPHDARAALRRSPFPSDHRSRGAME